MRFPMTTISLLALAGGVFLTAAAYADFGDQLAKLLPDDGEEGDRFGVSVAISDTTAIIGAAADDDNGVKSGSAYLFNTTSGQQIAKLLPNDGAADDIFGISVSISGATAIVGAQYDDDNGSFSGSAYLFDTTTGQQIAKLLPDDLAPGDWFGHSVAISGTIAIIAAPLNDDNGPRSGSAYLFDTTTGQQIVKLLPDDGAANDWFGHSVAISGTTAIVGAIWDADNGEKSGSAYLFDVTTHRQIAKLLPSDGEAGDWFGRSVAINGTTAIVGAFWHDDNGANSGSVYLFDTSTGQQIAKLLPNDGAEHDWFGRSVALNGTMTIVGANRDDDNGSSSGSVYLFDTAGCPEDSDGKGHVTICHIPTGNPDNSGTITVKANAVAGHLAHGDTCGPCGGHPCIPTGPPGIPEGLTVWYVDDDSCPEPGSGSEADPFCKIQDAIDAAGDGDEVVVHPGNYVENINLLGKAITVHSLHPTDPLCIESTVIDGSQPEPHSSGTVVTFNSSEDRDTMLLGFTLTHANPGSYGRGIRFAESSSPTIAYCFITNNSGEVGGGIYCGSGSPKISNCKITDNSAAVGGGLSISPSCSPIIMNSLIAGNSVNGYGGGISSANADATFANCSITNNSAEQGGGGFGGSGKLINCVAWGNQAEVGPQLAAYSGILKVRYSDVEGGESEVHIFEGASLDWGNGNIDLDPLFVNFDIGDFQLLPGSPVIDAADNTAIPADCDIVDLDGNPRFVDDPDTPDTGNPDGEIPIVDMGAYEFQDPCADNDGDGQVTICHKPNSGNPQTMNVNQNNLPAHLGHGDHCGPCEE